VRISDSGFGHIVVVVAATPVLTAHVLDGAARVGADASAVAMRALFRL
jgi:hypothetical protein